MKRNIITHLLQWKNNPNRMPLLIRGARQVGKSYSIEYFGKQYFDSMITINFEFTPQYKACFSTLHPDEILRKIELVSNKSIDKNKTLIFFDEIQECPAAITALRYFKETLPELAIIGAGSLLEFVFKSEQCTMPVGRIEFLNLEPMTFTEFLEASDNDRLHDYVASVDVTKNVDDVLHDRLLELLKIYFVIGGMPHVVSQYVANKDIVECQRIQMSLLETFRRDFGKYAHSVQQHTYIQKVFDMAPRLTGQRLKYVNIDRETRSRDLKNALELLTMAKVVRPIYHSNASGLPLGACINKDILKLTFLDVGLMQNICGLQGKIIMEKDIMQINAGAVCEQFVGQELRAYAEPYIDNQLFFWARDKRGSQAEVDYLFVYEDHMIPVEVKAGSTGTLKSLVLFMNERKSKIGIKLSTDTLSLHNNILSVPLYMIDQLPRLVHSAM